MSSKAQKIRVGVFVAITALLLAIVLAVFAGLQVWEGRDRYRIVFTDSVMGLEPGARVFLNGIKVGTVERVAIDPGDLRNVLVTIAVTEGTPIRANTEAMLQYAGITGLKVIDLRNATSDAPRLPSGGRIAAGQTVLDKLQAQAATIADQATELVTRANKLVGQLEGMDEVVANLRDASGELAAMIGENRRALSRSLAAIEQTAKSATTILDGQVSQLVANADSLITDVKSVVQRNDTALRSAVFDLRQASRSFKELARDVRQRPSRLLFSEPARDRKLP